MTENYFGREGAQYKAARPGYPAELFVHVANLVKERGTVLDVGCGSGQASVPLSAYFNRVVAIDESAGQLVHASHRPNIDYIRTSASRLPVKDESVDLVTVATAMHWFDLEKFHKEVDRVLKPSGAIAAWAYYFAHVNDKTDEILKDFYEDRLAKYIDQRRKWIIDGYESIPFPFAEKKKTQFSYTAEADFNRFLSLQRSSSMVQKEIELTGHDPLEEIESSLRKAWGNKEIKPLSWSISLLEGKKIPSPRFSF